MYANLPKFAQVLLQCYQSCRGVRQHQEPVGPADETPLGPPDDTTINPGQHNNDDKTVAGGGKDMILAGRYHILRQLENSWSLPIFLSAGMRRTPENKC